MHDPCMFMHGCVCVYACVRVCACVSECVFVYERVSVCVLYTSSVSVPQALSRTSESGLTSSVWFHESVCYDLKPKHHRHTIPYWLHDRKYNKVTKNMQNNRTNNGKSIGVK